MRPLQRRTKPGVNSRMKPARQTRSIRCACSSRIERALERRAIVAERPMIDDGGRDAGFARVGEAGGVGPVR